MQVMHFLCSFIIGIDKALGQWTLCAEGGYLAIKVLQLYFNGINYVSNASSSLLLLSAYLVPRNLTNNLFCKHLNRTMYPGLKYSANINSSNNHYEI